MRFAIISKGQKLITFFPTFSLFLFWLSPTKTSVSEPDGIDNSYQPAGWSNGSYVSELFGNIYAFALHRMFNQKYGIRFHSLLSILCVPTFLKLPPKVHL
jgi:hypothetical protein